MSPEKISDSLDIVLEASTADQVEVVIYQDDSALTRFSVDGIHQNMAETNSAVSIRSIYGRRIGTAFTNKLDAETIKKVVAESEKNARLTPPVPDFVSLPPGESITSTSNYIEATAQADPRYRAEVVGRVIKRAGLKKQQAAGSFSTGATTIGVANSLGARAIGKISESYLNLVLMNDKGGSGFAEFLSKDINQLQLEKLIERALTKAEASANPEPIQPDAYTVILEPAAVADMIGFLAYAGFGALSVQERRSFMAGNLGRDLVSPKISIWDDADDPRTIGLPFDFEAVPKQKVIFFNHGRAEQVVYDSYTAGREQKKSTGHALPAPNSFGPVPMNLIIDAGDESVAEMIAATKKGILVTRFHYTNLEDPLKTIFTGMTRDGTFLIENGRLTKGLKNLRFTQNILTALNNVEMVSKKRELVKSFIGSCLAPTMKISNFNFTGLSEENAS